MRLSRAAIPLKKRTVNILEIGLASQMHRASAEPSLGIRDEPSGVYEYVHQGLTGRRVVRDFRLLLMPCRQVDLIADHRHFSPIRVILWITGGSAKYSPDLAIKAFAISPLR
jgi:hypothetical protein